MPLFPSLMPLSAIYENGSQRSRRKFSRIEPFTVRSEVSEADEVFRAIVVSQLHESGRLPASGS